jgi:hypothetical protein
MITSFPAFFSITHTLGLKLKTEKKSVTTGEKLATPLEYVYAILKLITGTRFVG